MTCCGAMRAVRFVMDVVVEIMCVCVSTNERERRAFLMNAHAFEHQNRLELDGQRPLATFGLFDM